MLHSSCCVNILWFYTFLTILFAKISTVVLKSLIWGNKYETFFFLSSFIQFQGCWFFVCFTFTAYWTENKFRFGFYKFKHIHTSGLSLLLHKQPADTETFAAALMKQVHDRTQTE